MRLTASHVGACYGVRAACNCSYHCQKQTTIWNDEKMGVILCAESGHLILIRLAHNVLNVKVNEAAISKLHGYYSLVKQKCKHEIFITCRTLYFGVAVLYLSTR
jgi:hypothetical protein